MSVLLQTALIASLVGAQPIASAPSYHQPSGLLDPRYGPNDINHDDVFELVARNASSSNPFSLQSTQVDGAQAVVLRDSKNKEPSGLRFYMSKDTAADTGSIYTLKDTYRFVISQMANQHGMHSVTLEKEVLGTQFLTLEEEKHPDDLVYLKKAGSYEFLLNKFYSCQQEGDQRENINQLFYGPANSSSGICEAVRLYPLCSGDFNAKEKNWIINAKQAACFNGMKAMINKGFIHGPSE